MPRLKIPNGKKMKTPSNKGEGLELLKKGWKNALDGLAGLVGGATHAIGSVTKGVGSGVAHFFDRSKYGISEAAKGAGHAVEGTGYGVREVGKGVGHVAEGAGYGVKGFGRGVRNIAKSVSEAKVSNKDVVKISYKDLKALQNMEPEKQAKALEKYLVKQQGKKIVEVPTSKLEGALESLKYKTSDEVVSELEGKMASAKEGYVIMSKERWDKLKVLEEGAPDNPMKKFMQSGDKVIQKGNVKIPADELASAITAYHHNKGKSPLETIARYTTLILFSASIILLAPDSMTGFAVLSGETASFSYRSLVGVAILTISLLLISRKR